MPSTKNAPKTTPTMMAHLTRLADAKEPATAAAVDSNSIYMGRLEKEGLVKVVDSVQSGKRGRPAHIYRVTDKGRKRVQRAQARKA